MVGTREEMDSFAFIIHPVDPRRDVARKYPLLGKVLPARLIHALSQFWPPVYLSHVTGVRSAATGKAIEGWLLACPLTAQQMLRLSPETVYRKVVQTGRLAEDLGAGILGLGAFASVAGDGGVTIARRLGVPVTTGHSLTVAVAVDALLGAARDRGVRPARCTAAVVGATGSIGSACAEMIAPRVAELVLVGRQEARLLEVMARVRAAGGRSVRIATDMDDVRKAHLVLSATSAARPVVYPRHLGRGAIVCDIARPFDVSPRVLREREDVLLVEGGVVDVPGDVDFGFSFGLPTGKAYACMAEAMLLALEGWYESYSLGKRVELERVHEMAQLALKHGVRASRVQGYGRRVAAEVKQAGVGEAGLPAWTWQGR